MQFITIDDNTTNAGSQVAIKDEPMTSIDIKKEVITEQDNLVQVNQGIKPQFSEATMQIITIDVNTPHAGSQVAIKNEPMMSIDIKEEVITEQDNLVQVNQGIKPQFSEATMQFITVDVNTTNAGSQVAIKDEPLTSIDIKEEVITEQDNLVQVNQGIKPQFSEATMQIITIDVNTPHAGSQVAIKNIPMMSIDIKEEVITEQDNLVQVNQGIKPQFSEATMPFITFDVNTTNAGSQVAIKEEPMTSIDIKEEVTTEQDNLVQVKPVAESFTKNQILLEDSNREKELTINSHFEQSKPDDSKMPLKTPFACNVCDKQFNKSHQLVTHMRIHTGVKPFACNFCDKQFNQNINLVTHMRIHTGVKQFACNVCDKQFNENHCLVSHMRIHTGEKPFVCNVCDKQFHENCRLVSHMRIHTGDKPFVCNVCEKQFNENRRLVSHMRIHTGRKPYVCNVCDKQFSHNYHLETHMRIHTGVKPFACNICDKKFNQNINLVTHMRIHTGVKPFACNVCDKQFNQHSNLVAHMRIHTKVKPFACNVCDKQFNRNHNLVIHKRIHTGEKPFACNVCDKQFADKSAQTRHMLIHKKDKSVTLVIRK